MINRIIFCAAVCWFSIGMVGAADSRPNFVFLLSDDQRPDTIGALGNSIIDTPNLDRLVRGGTAMTRAHCTHPLCVPSRAEILTGASGFRNGIMSPYSNELNSEVVFWPAAMRDAGYRTYYVGKWHTSGRPSTRGYTDTLGLFSGGGSRFWKDQVDFKGIPITGYRGWIFQTDDRQLFPEHGVGLTGDISRHFADAAIELIGRKSDAPFFLHVNFTAPHDPLIMPPGYAEKYDPEKMPLPENYLPEHPFDHGNSAGRDEMMLPWPRTKQAVRENLAMYYRVISHMDEQIGRILDAIEQSGQHDNTVVIFASDHGLAVGSHGLMGKQNMYDHTIVVPLIFRGPGIPRGHRRKALAYLRDLFPTVCEMAGIEVPDSVQGRSLLPAIQKDEPIYETLFCYFKNAQRMVRDDQWKLIFYPQIDRYQLFHMQSDPSELKNLAPSEQHVAQLTRMKALLHDQQKQFKDPELTPSPKKRTRNADQ